MYIPEVKVEMQSTSTRARQPGPVASGFTLIEAMIATVIVGVGVTALLAVMASGTRANSESVLLTRGVFIAQQMRERLVLLPYSDPQTGDITFGPEESATGYFVLFDDKDDFDGAAINPPMGVSGAAMTGFGSWRQLVSVHGVDVNNFRNDYATTSPQDMIQINIAAQFLDPSSGAYRIVTDLTWVDILPFE